MSLFGQRHSAVAGTLSWRSYSKRLAIAVTFYVSCTLVRDVSFAVPDATALASSWARISSKSCRHQLMQCRDDFVQCRSCSVQMQRTQFLGMTPRHAVSRPRETEAGQTALTEVFGSIACFMIALAIIWVPVVPAAVADERNAGPGLALTGELMACQEELGIPPSEEDPWWTEERIDRYYNQLSSQGNNAVTKYRAGPSPLAGCGVFARTDIAKGEQIAPVLVAVGGGQSMKDPSAHITPWYGLAVNHCPGRANSHLERRDVSSLKPNNAVYSVASRDIKQGEEITGDYNEDADEFYPLIDVAPSNWTCDPIED